MYRLAFGVEMLILLTIEREVSSVWFSLAHEVREKGDAVTHREEVGAAGLTDSL